MNILKHIKIAGLALALGAGMLAASQASAQTVSDIVKRGKVKVGVLIGAPPYGSVDAQGNAIGYDADVTALVGKYLGVPVEVVQLTRRRAFRRWKPARSISWSRRWPRRRSAPRR